jgi:uncharacterized RDD family membrane protein YckC
MTMPDDPNAQPPQYPPPPAPGSYSPPSGYYPPQAPPIPAAFGYGQVAPGSVPPGMYFDQKSGLLLPDGTELASIGRRIGAYFLGILLAIVTLGIGYIIWGLIVWGRGQTPALQVLGMRCWRVDERKVSSWGWMALRDFIGRIVESIVSIIAVVSFILMCAMKQRRTIHDYIGGTIVLYDPNKVLATK